MSLFLYKDNIKVCIGNFDERRIVSLPIVLYFTNPGGKHMKKKLIMLFVCIAMSLSLVACSDNGKKVSSQKTVSDENEKTTSAESTEGEIVEEDGMRKEPVITDKELNRSGETGPIKYNLKAIQVSKLTATTDDAADLLQIEKDKESALVAIDIEIENTSDDTISIYPDQGTITTNTKEQATAEIFLSDGLGGEMKGQIKKDGTVFFILKNSKADDINKITYYVDAPHDENFDSVGDDIEVELNFK